jgi:hypothetical protein
VRTGVACSALALRRRRLLTHALCFSPHRWNDHSKYVGITDATQINTIDYINNLGAGAHLMIATTFGCVHRRLFAQQRSTLLPARSHRFTIFVIVFITAPISGGHINPGTLS